jgi:hypothetical protein
MRAFGLYRQQNRDPPDPDRANAPGGFLVAERSRALTVDVETGDRRPDPEPRAPGSEHADQPYAKTLLPRKLLIAPKPSRTVSRHASGMVPSHVWSFPLSLLLMSHQVRPHVGHESLTLLGGRHAEVPSWDAVDCLRHVVGDGLVGEQAEVLYAVAEQPERVAVSLCIAKTLQIEQLRDFRDRQATIPSQ